MQFKKKFLIKENFIYAWLERIKKSLVARLSRFCWRYGLNCFNDNIYFIYVFQRDCRMINVSRRYVDYEAKSSSCVLRLCLRLLLPVSLASQFALRIYKRRLLSPRSSFNSKAFSLSSSLSFSSPFWKVHHRSHYLFPTRFIRLHGEQDSR